MWDKKIIAISDSQNTQGDFLNFIEKLSQSSIDALVLREKHLDELEYAKLAKDVGGKIKFPFGKIKLPQKWKFYFSTNLKLKIQIL